MEGKQRASIKRGESVNAYNNSLANSRWVEDSRGLCATMDRGIHYRRCNLPVVKTDIYIYGEEGWRLSIRRLKSSLTKIATRKQATTDQLYWNCSRVWRPNPLRSPRLPSIKLLQGGGAYLQGERVPVVFTIEYEMLKVKDRIDSIHRVFFFFFLRHVSPVYVNRRYGYPFVPLNDLETDNVDVRLTILRVSSKSGELITAKPWLALIHRITRAKGSHVFIQMWNGLNGCFLFLFYFFFLFSDECPAFFECSASSFTLAFSQLCRFLSSQMQMHETFSKHLFSW